MSRLFDIRLLRAFTLKRIWNIIRVHASFHLSKILKRHILWGDPYILTIEPVNYCNLSCPQCATGSGQLGRDKTKMQPETYEAIIDVSRQTLCYLVLYNQGEPFLHEGLIDFIRYAKRSDIYIITSTNGHFLEKESTVKDIVSSGLDAIIVSLDGLDESTYTRYRKNGNYKKVIDGIQKLVHIRDSSGKAHPRIYIQFLVMKHNAHQMQGMKTLGRELKVDRVLFKTVQVSDADEADTLLPDDASLHRYEITEDGFALPKRSSPCRRLWTSSTILCDGSVVPCCFDKRGQYVLGIINSNKKLNDIWLSSEYKKFRDRVIRERGSIDICGNCTEGQKVYI
jgi:MoaA/NifB/PqqE/SkfB family radical SAM enzyme